MKAILYVGPPGSGKSFTARHECDVVYDDVTKETTYENHPDKLIGLTTPMVFDEFSVYRVAEDAKNKGIDVVKVVAFIGKTEDLLHNVKMRNDGRVVSGAIKLFEGHYDPYSWKMDAFNFEIRATRKYNPISG